MVRNRTRRPWLVAANLVLLLAALPAVGRSETPPAQRVRSTPSIQPDRSPSEPERHRPASPSRGSSGTVNGSNDSYGDDDDDAGDAAGQVAGACCAGFVGAMAEGAANDPSDVAYEPAEYPEEGRYVEPEPAPPPATRPGPPARDIPPPEPPPGPFDETAAKQSLRQAARAASEQCETADEQLGSYAALVTFARSGRAANVELDPKPKSIRLLRCADAVFLRAEVPPFEGEEGAVELTFPEPTAEPTTPSAVPLPVRGEDE